MFKERQTSNHVCRVGAFSMTETVFDNKPTITGGCAELCGALHCILLSGLLSGKTVHVPDGTAAAAASWMHSR